MADIALRKEGRAGRVTLTRPQALNALDLAMCLAIETALDEWRDDPAVSLLIIDAEGDRAFCAGGDIARPYRDALAGDPGAGARFWRNEYRLNAKLAEYQKPIVALMQGFTMGGGVGLGGHAAHRIVGKRTMIAMPECAIGLVPDVGGSLLLARAPGRLGEYLALTGARMAAGDALMAGFADRLVSEERWPDLTAQLIATGDPHAIAAFVEEPPPAALLAHRPLIDRLFAASDLDAILRGLEADREPFAAEAAAAMRRNSPLSMACTLRLVREARVLPNVRSALMREYRYTSRAIEAADLMEGIRAQVIDKDRAPRWKHSRAEDVAAEEVAALLAPLDGAELAFVEEKPCA